MKCDNADMFPNTIKVISKINELVDKIKNSEQNDEIYNEYIYSDYDFAKALKTDDEKFAVSVAKLILANE